MKKHLLILSVLAFSLGQGSAQSSPTATPAAPLPRWTISVSAGGAFPAGKFGSQKVSDSTSSFAKIGPLVTVGLDYRLTPHYGLSLIIAGQENATDNKAITQQLEGIHPGVQYDVNISKWKIGRALVGGWVETALDRQKKWSLHVRLVAGTLMTKPPKSVMSTSQFTSTGMAFSSSNLTYPKNLWAFAWQTGTGLKYTLTRHWSFHLDADYAASTISVSRSYHNISQTAVWVSGSFFYTPGTIAIISAPPSQTFKLPVNALNLSAGAGFSF